MDNATPETEIVRASAEWPDALIPRFDVYRQFYEQPANPGAARAILTDRSECAESVIFLALPSTKHNGLALSTAVTNAPAQALCSSCGWARDEKFNHCPLFQ